MNTKPPLCLFFAPILGLLTLSAAQAQPHAGAGLQQITIHSKFYTVPSDQIPAGLKLDQAAMEDLLQMPPKGMDILGAPSLTTLSGMNAQVGVVREVIYPTEFTPCDDGRVVPQAFETRETGIILNATPTVSPGDEPTVNLATVIDITKLVGWMDMQDPRTIHRPRYAQSQPELYARNKLVDLKVQLAERRTTHAERHPEVAAIQAKIEALDKIQGEAEVPTRMFMPLFWSHNYTFFAALKSGETLYLAGGNLDQTNVQFFVSISVELSKVGVDPEIAAMEKQLAEIIIPELNFKNAALPDVIDFLRAQGGPNIVLVGEPDQKITLSLKQVGLRDALQFIAEIANLSFKVGKKSVTLAPRKKPDDPIAP